MNDLRELVRRFTEREIVPYLPDWERAGEVPRELHAKAAKLGLLGIGYPEEVGGGGGTLLDSATVTEELILGGGSSGLIAALFTHGIALPHIIATGDAALIDRYVRPTLAGELIGSLAITEPDGGSDVASLRTARKSTANTTSSTAARPSSRVALEQTSSPPRCGPVTRVRLRRVSLLVIDTTTDGFGVTRRLEKMGWQCSDTAELSFVDVRVPRSNLVGAEGTGIPPDHAALRERADLDGRPGVCDGSAVRDTHHRMVPRSVDVRRQIDRPAGRTASPRGDGRVTAVARTYVWSLADRIASGDKVSPLRWRWRRTRRWSHATTSSTRPCSCTVVPVIYVTPKWSDTTATPASWASAAARWRS
jgi:acyl-CoA dehydrogenase